MPNQAGDLVSIRVYYEDTDFSGSVYHASYLRFLERGRTEFLRRAGFGNREFYETDGVVFAVRSLQIDYILPALMDDLLSIETRIERMGGASLGFLQRVTRDSTELAVARIRVAVVRDGRPVQVPLRLQQALRDQHQ